MSVKPRRLSGAHTIVMNAGVALKFGTAADAMDESGGVIGEISYFHPIRMERLTLIPSVGVRSTMTKALTTIITAFRSWGPRRRA